MGLSLIPEGALNTPRRAQLHKKVRELSAAGDWASLLALRPDLEYDSRYWTDVWGPLCAVAARQTGDPGAMDLLEDLVEAGFCQPQRLNGQLESAFAEDPGWPQLLDRMRRHAPAPPLVLTEWPVITPAAPLGLLDLPHRTRELRALAPSPQASAWQTALAVLEWATTDGSRTEAHMEIDDAVECLRRVSEGQRFACMEYSLVLAQALNALGIPARRLSLRQDEYHVGIGRCHVVCEAWIDDFCSWVSPRRAERAVLDRRRWEPPRRGGTAASGQSGKPRPGYVTSRGDIGDGDADLWFSFYRGTASSAAGTWAPGSFGVVFQRTRLATSGRLEHRPDSLYPDLSQLSVETALDGEQPALRLASAHPYARGFTADGKPLASDLLPLDRGPGDHELMLAARTGYAALPGKPLRYRVERLDDPSPIDRQWW